MIINIFIIDDHKILVDSFIHHFESIANMEVIGYALSGSEAIEKLNPKELETTPDIIIQDIDLEDMDGIECTEQLLKLNPDLKIVGVSSYTESVIVKKMMKAGAKGYVSKATDIDNLETAIQQIYNGNIYMGQYITESLERDETGHANPKRKSLIPIISKRELDVLKLIAEELSSPEIAERLFISANTVQSHRKKLILKFDVKNSVGLVRKALEYNLLSE